jgi:hypothetical protein
MYGKDLLKELKSELRGDFEGEFSQSEDNKGANFRADFGLDDQSRAIRCRTVVQSNGPSRNPRKCLD